MRFFVGTHQPADAKHLGPVCISINRIRNRKSGFEVGDWLMDSGAFSEIFNHGRYRHSVKEYADAARRWIGNGNLLAIVAQDYMCEPFVLAKTGLTIADHQRLTIERYDKLLEEDLPVHVMPVLQGFSPSDYADHVRQYGARLTQGMWVGVGSVCKRQGDPALTARVLSAILDTRPDLRLHGFGVKLSSLNHNGVRRRLLQRGQHGVELCSSQAGPEPKRLAGGQTVCRSRDLGQIARHMVAARSFLTTGKEDGE